MLVAVRRLWWVITPTVASMFLIRWCNLAWIRCCNLSAASRSSAIDPGLDEQRLGVDARLLERQFRLSFSVVSASRNGWFSSMISCCFSVLSTV